MAHFRCGAPLSSSGRTSRLLWLRFGGLLRHHRPATPPAGALIYTAASCRLLAHLHPVSLGCVVRPHQPTQISLRLLSTYPLAAHVCAPHNGRSGIILHGAAAAAATPKMCVATSAKGLPRGRALDQSCATGQTVRVAFSLLRQHVFCHLAEANGAHYVARMGIPQVCNSHKACCDTWRPAPLRSRFVQGSIISARLCSLHLATAEHAMLARFLPRIQSLEAATNAVARMPCDLDSTASLQVQLQLRVVDDTLHVRCRGNSTETAEVNAGVVTAAQPEGRGRNYAFGCVPNLAKFREYRSLQRPSAQQDRAAAGSGHGVGRTLADGCGGLFHWCGWLIDVGTSEVRQQFVRFANAKPTYVCPGEQLCRIPPAQSDALEHRQDGSSSAIAKTAPLTVPSLPARGRRSDRRPRDGKLPRWALSCLAKALLRAARPKLHAAFLDPYVNSPPLCRRNHVLAHACV